MKPGMSCIWQISGRSEVSFEVKALPGMAGLWQVSGKNELTFEDRLRLEEYR